jgi:hypothetical protein
MFPEYGLNVPQMFRIVRCYCTCILDLTKSMGYTTNHETTPARPPAMNDDTAVSPWLHHDDVAHTVSRQVAKPVSRQVAKPLSRQVAHTVGRQVARTVSTEVAHAVSRQVAHTVSRQVAHTVSR